MVQDVLYERRIYFRLKNFFEHRRRVSCHCHMKRDATDRHGDLKYQTHSWEWPLTVGIR